MSKKIGSNLSYEEAKKKNPEIDAVAWCTLRAAKCRNCGIGIMVNCYQEEFCEVCCPKKD